MSPDRFQLIDRRENSLVREIIKAKLPEPGGVSRWTAEGKLVHPVMPHNIPFVMLGTFILAFGWFGFNPGSSLAGTDLRIAVVAVNTMLASATGALAATLWMWWVRTKKPDPSMMCNGMLAGLVAITCPCAFVSAGGASILGAIAGVLVVESVFFFDKIGIDDCVGAISVHGVNGAWGCLSLGLFADGTYGSANGSFQVRQFSLTTACRRRSCSNSVRVATSVCVACFLSQLK